MAGLLELEYVSHLYFGKTGNVRALDDVSLTLEPGNFTAVVGPSGCGKSTLLLCAGGLLKPMSGTVKIDGTDPYSLSADARADLRAKSIGFVFQQFHLVPFLSVRENILAPTMAVDGADESTGLKRADELIEQFGLQSRSGHVPAELSSGERQRTALARALFNRPKLLLADEPTGNLDRENGEIVLDCLRKFADDGGAVLLVTHDEQAITHAGDVIKMSKGQIETPTAV